VSKRTDIWQQIRKYLNGELDTRAMHRFERRSQADPFLRDALDGYELKGADQDKNLKELASRLKSRTQRRERRIIPLRFIATAATILIFLFAGLLWFINRPVPTQPKTQIAKVKPVPQIKTTPVDSLLNPAKKTEVAILTTKKRHHALVSPNVVAEQNAIAQSSPEADVNIAMPTGNSDAKVIEADPVQVYPDSSYAKRVATAQANKNSLAEVLVTGKQGSTITGIVTAKDDGLPIPGATVMIKGTNINTQTNPAGKFTLQNVPAGATLVLTFIGYLPQQITTDKKNYLAVVMQPNTNSLAEVVVTGALGVKHNNTDDDQDYEYARPANGWSSFNKYLKANAISPDGKTGVVKVSFTVSGYGQLSDFKIKKSLSDATDDAAITLIKRAGRWLANTYHKPENVSVRVRFKQTKPAN
jgi:TonB family protein